MLDQVEGLREILAAHSNHIHAEKVPTANDRSFPVITGLDAQAAGTIGGHGVLFD
jgi:hypothetical protein